MLHSFANSPVSIVLIAICFFIDLLLLCVMTYYGVILPIREKICKRKIINLVGEDGLEKLETDALWMVNYALTGQFYIQLWRIVKNRKTL